MICYLSRNYKGVSGAGNKAKTDIEQIMELHGFHNVGLKQARYTHTVVAFCYTLFSVVKSAFCLRKGDVLILQYPLKKYYTFVCNVAHWRGCKVVTLIHDLGCFRSKRLTVSQEISRLNHSDSIIVHSEAMKEWLEKKGIKAKLQILEIFDYLSANRQGTEIKSLGLGPGRPYRVMFAGVLASCHNDFLYQMANAPRSYELIFYGSGFEPDRLHAEVNFKGFVSSDDLIATAEGDFGIVWYGPALEGGKGPLGEYLQYNAPHKMSLYIRCGLPVIIWEKAGLSSFVRDNKIGICISSLEELEDVFTRMTVEEYQEMKRNVKKINDRLSRGFYTFEVIKRACADLDIFF